MNTEITDDQLVRLSSKLLDGMISDEEHLHLNQMLMSFFLSNCLQIY